MHLNFVKAITDSSAISLFYENHVIRICKPRRLYQGQIRAMYWIILGSVFDFITSNIIINIGKQTDRLHPVSK